MTKQLSKAFEIEGKEFKTAPLLVRRDRDAVALHRQHGELAFQDVQSRARAAVERALERLYVYLLTVEGGTPGCEASGVTVIGCAKAWKHGK